jgi:predicted Zn finger-like uncharacterized protein
MNISCPDCKSVFRVDPAKVPAAGVRARCSVCSGIIPIPPPSAQVAPAPVAPVAEPARAAAAPRTAAASAARTGTGTGPSTAPATGRRPINPFLAKDPDLRARRLARALVSDIITYHPAKHAEGLRDGTVRELFKDEIRKSYEEYTAQIGQQVAENTPYFQDALNEVLGAGKKIF